MEGTPTQVPTSILIIGTGVFGPHKGSTDADRQVSTADSLLTNPAYAKTDVTLIDAYVPPADSQDAATGAEIEASAAALTSSLDSSRIIRTDYAKLAYAQLAAAAQVHWRGDWPLATRTDGKAPPVKLYHQTGLICSGSEINTNSRGREYVEASFANVQSLQPSGGYAQALESRDAVREAFRGTREPPTPDADDTSLGDFGYINHLSGWADASGAMAALRARVRKRAAEREHEGGSRVNWIHGRVERLLYEKTTSDGHVVVGAKLEDGHEIRAAVTIIAAGAWSPLLLPRTLGSRVHASGEPLAYIALSEAERKQLAGRPVLLNLGTALFVIPPPPEGAADAHTCSVLKVAQHGWGYARRIRVRDTEPGADASAIVEISVPPSTTRRIPPRSERDLQEFATNVLPDVARGKAFSGTRLCWYADTASGDFLIDFVPQYGRTCLVVTGGSGHGFKFLPVIGKYVVERLEGRLGKDDEPRNGHSGPKLPPVDDLVGPEHATGGEPLDKTLAYLWRWRSEEELEEDRKMPGDGSRGGPQGLVWEDEMREVEGWEPPER